MAAHGSHGKGEDTGGGARKWIVAALLWELQGMLGFSLQPEWPQTRTKHPRSHSLNILPSAARGP